MKNCNFCRKAKKKFNGYILLAIYSSVLVILGQIELIKIIYNFISSF